MIFVGLGTHSQEFNRLAEAIDKYAGFANEEIIVQTGFTSFKFQNINRYFGFCSKEEMYNYLKSADVVVLQGGWGAIDEALTLHKKIVAVPRIEGFEHVHNQEQLVRKLESKGCLVGCYDTKDIANCIKKARCSEFKSLKKGSASSSIKQKLSEWFG